MGIATSQQLTKYYDQYRDTEITFTKDIIRALGLDPRQVYVKCNGGQWPCIINSTSFQHAKIIVGTKGGAFQALAVKDAPTASIRFCFNEQEDDGIITFLVSSRVAEIRPYMNSKDLVIVTLQFTARPPDDLIEIVGRLLEANANAIRRREERVLINDDSKRKLNLAKEECNVIVQSVPRHCVVRDLSFSGARVILIGLSQYLTSKEAILRLEFNEPSEIVSVRGTIVSADLIQGRKDVCIASIKFDEASLPLSFKMHLNSYLTTVRKTQLSASEQQQAVSAPQVEQAQTAQDQQQA
ncbi:MAG: PilZ domain-containing protein [Treponema sp.]|uniref:PilZ domain-containing protein n=1 Tax=Treponema sp. TaxID=166 RepID=UPI0025F0C46D|nr:PilZ domain-containing protein [Treponema sp.]MBQ8678919.1 PilZ domain-containing protein [Treponema sp.]